MLVIGVAELGLDAAKAEYNLSKLFDLATKWEALLLIDEADVFLETRSTSDMARNALVSAFLRCLEYYRGTIILTTNRIRTFDMAVLSRIHLTVRYEDLTGDQMKTIFKNFLDQISPDMIADREELDTFIRSYGPHYDFNGRQIRNVVSLAMAAASNETRETGAPAQYSAGRRGDGRLTSLHLKQACDITSQLDEQLRDTIHEQRQNNEVLPVSRDSIALHRRHSTSYLRNEYSG